MKRPVRIAVKAITIYVALSLVVAVVMAELTLHPMRLPLPDRARIAAMYAPYGADLQPVVIQAVDGVELHAWYSVPNIKMARQLFCFTELATTVAAWRDMVRRFFVKAIAFCCPIRGRTESRVAPWRPTAWAKATTFTAGSPGSMVEEQAVSMALENRWAPRWCWRAYVPIPGFARLLPILRSQPSVVWPTIGKEVGTVRLC